MRAGSLCSVRACGAGWSGDVLAEHSDEPMVHSILFFGHMHSRPITQATKADMVDRCWRRPRWMCNAHREVSLAVQCPTAMFLVFQFQP
ncbi:hypothetical protein C8R44DRAFT_18428 [Mycena epipterygia]|nr:hypothetical protein C8R44DRAFT_18428 [Mycena epipterygia]